VFADDQDASHIGVNDTVDSGHPQPGHDERLFAALARQFLRLAEIGGIRRIGDDDVRECVRVDPAQALAFVDDDRLVAERPVARLSTTWSTRSLQEAHGVE
jgi:hypothetical protein